MVTLMNDELELLLSGLNEQQKEIVRADENLLVTACPGSGKTRVILLRNTAFLNLMIQVATKSLMDILGTTQRLKTTRRCKK